MATKAIQVPKQGNDDGGGWAFTQRLRTALEELDSEGYRIIAITPVCGASGVMQTVIVSGQKQSQN
jgi:hypothetical protein